MNGFQHQFCTRIMDKLEARPICKFFIEVKPANLDRTLYFREHSRDTNAPFDLAGVRQKLANGEYKSVNEWAMDIRYIWTHTRPKNDTEQHYDAIASELLRYFEKKWAEFPRSERENWARQLKKAGALAAKVYDKMPKVCAELLPEEKTEE